jgi:hypothetical protein
MLEVFTGSGRRRAPHGRTEGANRCREATTGTGNGVRGCTPGDANAAVAVGATYDPTALAKLGAVGIRAGRHVRSIDCDLFLQVEAIDSGKSKIEHQTTRGPRTGGAGGGNRTPHLPITIWLLYHLSYTGLRCRTLCDSLASYNQNLSHASGFPDCRVGALSSLRGPPARAAAAPSSPRSAKTPP